MFKMKSLFLLSTSISLASAVCTHGTTLFPWDASTAVPVAEFGYDGLTGPLNWYGLDNSTSEACSMGKNQSPINIITRDYTPVQGSSLDLEIEHYPKGTELINLGSTLEVFANGSITGDGKDYSLKQFHFHTPGEHRINDEFYPLEVHFVFQADDQSISVLGIPIEIAEIGWDLFSEIFKHIEAASVPGTEGPTGPLDFSRLQRFVRRSAVYQYSGSLTTPPCTEGVAWNVLAKPIFVDVKTYWKVKKVMKYNARYTQNAPGGINLLDNAREVLDGTGK